MWFVILVWKLQRFKTPICKKIQNKYKILYNNIKQYFPYSDVRLCSSWAIETHPEPTVSEPPERVASNSWSSVSQVCFPLQTIDFYKSLHLGKKKKKAKLPGFLGLYRTEKQARKRRCAVGEGCMCPDGDGS